MWTPWAGQDHPGPCNSKACWLLCGGNECKVSGREGPAFGAPAYPHVSGGVWETGGLEAGLGSSGLWDLGQPCCRLSTCSSFKV